MLTRNGIQDDELRSENTRCVNISDYRRKTAGMTRETREVGGVNNPSTASTYLRLVDRIRQSAKQPRYGVKSFGTIGISEEELTEGWPDSGYNSGNQIKCPAVLVTPRTRHGKD